MTTTRTPKAAAPSAGNHDPIDPLSAVSRNTFRPEVALDDHPDAVSRPR